MKTFEKLSYYIPFLAITYFAIGWFWDSQEIRKSIKEIQGIDEMPLQVKILEPNVTGLSFNGVEGELFWLEGSPMSETDFLNIKSKSSRITVQNGAIIKVPEKTSGYILRAKISKEGFTVDQYFGNPKFNVDTTPEDDSF